MQVAQRGTSTASITTSGYYTADRWKNIVNSMGTWTQSVENDAPAGSGFRKSIKVLCTTADAAPAASDATYLQQYFEGQDFQRIAKGTSNAQQLTLSFWVKSNVTGTYVATLYDHDNNRQVSASYSISASATWEKKIITFPADTTGELDNDNQLSISISFWLGSGSDRSSGTLATTWVPLSLTDIAAGQTNLAAAVNNYWQITGVQLEVGDTATDFEHKPYGVELTECQRYYYRLVSGTSYGRFALGMSNSTTAAHVPITLPTTMRVTPSLESYSGLRLDNISGGYPCTISIYVITSTAHSVLFLATTTGLTAFQTYFLGSNNDPTAYIGLAAEL
jgi:hypothetical protein